MPFTPLPRGVAELDRAPLFRNAEQLLSRAEAEIRLIDRVQPVNAAAEREALIQAWGASRARAPRFEYRTRPDLSRLRRELEAAARGLESTGGPLGALYASRARELESEASLAEQVGQPDFATACAHRYPLEASTDAAAADARAARWIVARDEQRAMLHKSDDRSDPESLYCQLDLAARGLPVRVEIRSNQAAAATVGERFIGVRPGLWHSRLEVRRIVVHEIDGHVRPRVSAQREALGLFRVGSAASSDDEEGRALLLERRARALGGARRRELARRHIAARNARRGVSFVDTTRELLGYGQDIASALEATCRAYRGGGFGRELVYLVALSRVTRAFEADPDLETWFERGRLSVHAARACATGLGF